MYDYWLISQGVTKKKQTKKSLPKHNSLALVVSWNTWKTPCRSDRPPGRANVITILRRVTTCMSSQTRFMKNCKLWVITLSANKLGTSAESNYHKTWNKVDIKVFLHLEFGICWPWTILRLVCTSTRTFPFLLHFCA